MKKPTPTDIKRAGVLGEFFFSPDTLRFFGQTMRSFKTEWWHRDSGVVRLHAPVRDSDGQLVGTTERFVRVADGELRQVRCWEVTEEDHPDKTTLTTEGEPYV
jgi:hypothetical protein